jgi:REP element-mobilizing transposase RayT
MPDHIHGVISRIDRERGGSTGHYQLQGHARQTRPDNLKRHALPEIVRAFKSFSARRINDLRQMRGAPVWQRNFYDRIIRDPAELGNIEAYIRSNPLRWAEDPRSALEQR